MANLDQIAHQYTPIKKGLRTCINQGLTVGGSRYAICAKINFVILDTVKCVY